MRLVFTFQSNSVTLSPIPIPMVSPELSWTLLGPSVLKLTRGTGYPICDHKSTRPGPHRPSPQSAQSYC